MIRLYRIAFWAALVVAFAMAALPHPPFEVRLWDKLQHMAAFGVLTVLGCFAYPRASRIKLALWLIAYGGFIELVQMIPMLWRDSDWHDWLADTLAVLLALGAVSLAGKTKTRQPD